MKKLFGLYLFVCCSAVLTPLVLMPGCQTAPSQRKVEVITLQALAASMDTTMKIVAQAFKDKRITNDQAYEIDQFHDTKFQPAYNLAVAAVQGNLSSLASPDLQNLANQLSAIVGQYIK